MLVGVVVIGTVGCMAIEGGHPLGALYMTVISVTTVGYKESAPPEAGTCSRG